MSHKATVQEVAADHHWSTQCWKKVQGK